MLTMLAVIQDGGAIDKTKHVRQSLTVHTLIWSELQVTNSFKKKNKLF